MSHCAAAKGPAIDDLEVYECGESLGNSPTWPVGWVRRIVFVVDVVDDDDLQTWVRLPPDLL